MRTIGPIEGAQVHKLSRGLGIFFSLQRNSDAMMIEWVGRERERAKKYGFIYPIWFPNERMSDGGSERARCDPRDREPGHSA